MSDSITVADSDKKWQIESDARTLKEAEMIKADPKRYEPAIKELSKEMEAMHNAMADKMFPSMKKEDKGGQ